VLDARTRSVEMPLIKARTHRVPIVRHVCHLQEPNRAALVQYALFIGDTVDYVLNQLIATTLAKDREFVAWRAAQPLPIPTTKSAPARPPHASAARVATPATEA
jgi:hypothetical protein